MRAIGFSTGAIAPGDVSRGIELLAPHSDVGAVELSALRLAELPSLVEQAMALDLRKYRHVSVHAPSRFDRLDERGVIAMLGALPGAWPVVVHPDAMHDVELWALLGPRVVIENMDRRKRTGRTTGELRPFFEALPEAGFCLDVAHARDIEGGGMATIESLLDTFGKRLVKLHVSTLVDGDHRPLDEPSIESFREVRAEIPEDTVLIIEAVVESQGLSRELERVRRAFGD